MPIAPLSASFTATGVSAVSSNVSDGEASFSVSGTFVGTLCIERSDNGGQSWSKAAPAARAAASGVFHVRAGDLVRLRCVSYTSGTIFGQIIPTYTRLVPPGAPAPRRTLLTKTLGSGLNPHAGAVSDAVHTYLYVMPIEAPCVAVRVGFANHANFAMAITKVAVVPSSSYSVLTANDNAGLLATTGATQYAVVPTGGAAGVPMTFDSAGAFNTTVNAAGTTRNLTLAADAGNTGNTPAAYTIKWTDLVPCVSIPRTDGGQQHLLFIYVSISNGGFTGPNQMVGSVYNADADAHQGRYHWAGTAWNNGTDYADNPTGTGFKFSIAVPVAVQYLTASPGIQTVSTGDSLSCAPNTDQFSTPLMRAGYSMSSPGFPIEFASMGWGGTASPIYNPTLLNNAPALRPSVVAYQPLSRNDGASVAVGQNLIAQAAMIHDTMSATYGSKMLWNCPGGEPSYDGTQSSIDAFNTLREMVLNLGAIGCVPVIDAPGIIGVPGSTWDYQAGYSTDNTHPNNAGAKAITAAAKAALQSLIGV
jgi:hypothetical protein